MHLIIELYGVILTALKHRNTYLRWIIKVMNSVGIYVSYQFHERGLYQMYYFFLISSRNKINFTHFIVYYMGKQHAEN